MIIFSRTTTSAARSICCKRRRRAGRINQIVAFCWWSTFLLWLLTVKTAALLLVERRTYCDWLPWNDKLLSPVGNDNNRDNLHCKKEKEDGRIDSHSSYRSVRTIICRSLYKMERWACFHRNDNFERRGQVHHPSSSTSSITSTALELRLIARERDGNW